MAAIANLVLNNAAAVAKTFVPTQKYGGANTPAVWKLKEGISPLAWPRVEIYQSRTSKGSTKVEFKLVVPEAVSIDGVPTLVSTCYFDTRTGGFVIPETATTTQIANTYHFAKNLLAHAMVQGWVLDQDPAF